MTTDPGSGAERSTDQDTRTARLEELRQRRAVSHPPADTAAPRRKPRKRHAAAAARILVASVSAGTAFVLGGFMARPATQSTISPAVASSAPQPVIVVVRRGSGTATSTVSPAPSVTPSQSAPVTASAAS